MAKKDEKKIDVKSKKTKIPSWRSRRALSRRDPFEMMDDIDRFWEDPWTPFWHRGRRSHAPGGWRMERWIDENTKETSIDMIDTGDEFKIIADMPGVSKEDVDVTITSDGVSICGETQCETKEEDEGYVRRERRYSTLCRTMPLPAEVDPDKANATLNDGVLEITVSKKRPSEGKGRNVPVK